jgi:putative photosynthetic complex assembly protein
MINSAPQVRRSPEPELIPKPLLRMMAGLVIASLVLTTFAVFTGRTPTGQPKASPVIAERTLVLRTGSAQAVALYDLDGTMLQDLPHGGFVTVIASGVDRARTVAHVAKDLPIVIARHQNGRLTASDPATGWSVELTAFGSGNEAAFQALLPQN